MNVSISYRFYCETRGRKRFFDPRYFEGKRVSAVNCGTVSKQTQCGSVRLHDGLSVSAVARSCGAEMDQTVPRAEGNIYISA